MAYTLPNGLRDREYSNYQAVQAGSYAAQTVIIVSGISNVKTYDFSRSNCTASAAGLFGAYTSSALYGELKAILVKNNNFTATGSLQLIYSGADIANYSVWDFVSGTNTSNVAASAEYRPVVYSRDQTNLSGTAINALESIPLYGVYRLVGSGLGNATSASGITLVYI